MIKKIVYYPENVCAQKFEFTIEDGILTDVYLTGGCPGNLAGMTSLMKGMQVTDVISRLKNIPCETSVTSCPDQIARALEESLNKKI